jgi:hypothetical protein
MELENDIIPTLKLLLQDEFLDSLRLSDNQSEVMGHEPESDGANKIDPNTYYIEFWLHWIHDSNADLPKAQCIPSLFDSPSAGVALANVMPEDISQPERNASEHYDQNTKVQYNITCVADDKPLHRAQRILTRLITTSTSQTR